SGTARILGAFATVFAYFLGYVDESLSWDVSLFVDDLVSLGAFSLVEGYAAFLVGDNHFGAGHAKGLVEFFHLLLPVGRGHLPVVHLVLAFCTDNALAVLGSGLVARCVVS